MTLSDAQCDFDNFELWHILQAKIWVWNIFLSGSEIDYFYSENGLEVAFLTKNAEPPKCRALSINAETRRSLEP